MKNVQVLDCTLRDGGRIIDCKFDDNVIASMAKDLSLAGIDIIEMGFLRDHKLVDYKGNSTFFTEVSQIEKFIPKRSNDAMYVAFVDFSLYDFSKLEACTGNSITGIRVGFTKKEFDTRREEIKKALLTVKEQGYALFVQSVNTLAYSDREILDLLDLINEIVPYSFGIVDTYGAMYLEDMIHFFDLIDYNLIPEVSIDIHSHNNFQSSFAFAQEIIRVANGRRNVILDATLNGMGKCAGNLNTELIVDYLVRKKEKDYDMDRVLDTIDKYLVPLKDNLFWGYSIPAFMAGVYRSHPNNVIYLTEKYRLNSKDIKYILSGIDEDIRQKYDYDVIRNIYAKYNENLIDDSNAVQELRELVKQKKILVLAPGKSIEGCCEQITEYIEKENPIVISINYIPKQYCCDFYFFANTIHWEKICDDVEREKCILASNIHTEIDNVYRVDYTSLIVEDSILGDNSTIMLLNLLKKLQVSEICLAGFDGLQENKENYVKGIAPGKTKELTMDEINKEIKKMYEQYKNKIKEKIKVSILTSSVYEGGGYNHVT